MRTHASFDDWEAAQEPGRLPVIRRLRELVKRAGPRLVESSKWGNGCWLAGDLPLLFLHAADDHLQFGFFGGALLNDPDGLLRGRAKFVRHVRIEGLDSIEEKALATLIRRAVRAPAYR